MKRCATRGSRQAFYKTQNVSKEEAEQILGEKFNNFEHAEWLEWRKTWFSEKRPAPDKILSVTQSSLMGNNSGGHEVNFHTSAWCDD
jgi:hypothetical protein